jgi:hypothetical protein
MSLTEFHEERKNTRDIFVYAVTHCVPVVPLEAQ